MVSDKKIIVFDFDGTLVDSMEAFADVAAKVMNRIYETPRKEARNQYIQTSGLPFFQQLEQIHPGDERNSVAVELFETEKLVGYFDQRVYPDVEQTISQLKKRGVKSAVSSNNFQYLVDEFIKRAGLKLDYILGFRDKSFCKGRSHFKYLLDQTGLNKNDILFVGDSLKDAERALDFDIDFVGKTGLFTKSDFNKHYPKVRVIRKLEELV